MEEEDHIHSNSTPSSHTLLHMAVGLLPMVAAPLSLFFSSLHSHTLSLCSKKHASFIGKHGEPLQHICQHGGANKALNHATKCGINSASTCLVVGYCNKWQYPNNHPLCHLCGQLSSCFFSTSLHSAAFPSFHSESIFNTTFPFERINHARSGMIFQASHQGLQHPLKRIFPSATVIKYFNVITSSPLFQESTHPGVAPALCSTLGTTPYFSVSLSLLVLRVQVALHL